MCKKDERFEILWNTFLRENEHVSPFYCVNWMRYQVAYAQEKHKDDLSFVAIDDSRRIVAICPLYLECHGDHARLSYRGEYLESLRAPLIANHVPVKSRDKYRKILFDEIDRIAASNKVAKCNFIIDPLCEDSQKEGYNYLTRYGYLDASMTTVLVDLRKGKENIWANLRNSYKSLINKSRNIYEVFVIDHSAISRAQFDAYAELHHKAAGRITRPGITFDIQYEMVEGDEACLIGVKAKGDWVSFAYFFHSRYSAYYGSGAEDPDVITETSLGPIMQWTGIEYYISRGKRYLELDNQYFGAQLFECPSQKEINISFFKRGFGGTLTPLYRGVKYYDKDLMSLELEICKNNLVTNYFPDCGKK